MSLYYIYIEYMYNLQYNILKLILVIRVYVVLILKTCT